MIQTLTLQQFTDKWRHRALAFQMLLAALLLLSACQNLPPAPTATTRPTATLTPRPTQYIIVTHMAARMAGLLRLSQGCLRVGGHTLVWPPEYGVSIEGDEVRVTSGLVSGQRSEVVLHPGEYVEMGGGGVPQLNEQLQQSIPAHCPGPYWVIGIRIQGLYLPTPETQTNAIVFLQVNAAGERRAIRMDLDAAAQAQGPLQTLTGAITRGEQAFFSPDGRWLLTQSPADRSLPGEAWNIKTGLQRGASPPELCSWEVDIMMVLNCGADGVLRSRSYDQFFAEDDYSIVLAEHPGGRILSAATSPDGLYIVYSYADEQGGEIWLMDSDGRRPRRLLRQAANVLSWSPDGRLLALYDDGWLYLSTPQGELLHRLGIVLSPCELSPLAWSPDGRQLLLVLAEYPQDEACSAEPDFNAPPLIQIVDTDSGTVSTWMADAFDPAWSPDGEWIAFVSTRSGATELWAARRDGSDLHQLTHDGLWLRFPNWVK